MNEHAAFGGGPPLGSKVVRFIYVDEAGTSQNNPHTVVAGAVVHGDDQLIPLEEHLDGLVEKHIPKEDREGFVFHMTDLWHGSRYFDRRKWAREKRLEIIKDIASIPRHFEMPILFGMAVRAESVKRYPQLNGNPATTSLFCHSIAFMGCTFVAEHLMREVHPNEVAQLIAENHDDAKRYIQDAHAIFRNPVEIKRRGIDDRYLPLERIRNNVLFSEKAECKPLQLADACAFIIRMHLRGDEPMIDPYYQQIKPWLSVIPKGEEPYAAPIGPAYPYGPMVEHYGK